MAASRRSVVRDTVLYGAGGIASQAVAILLVPIYARQLGVANYGVSAVINTTLSLGVMIAGLGLANAFFRWYLGQAGTTEERARVLSSSLSLRLAASAAALVAFAALAAPLATVVLGGDDVVPLFLLLAPTIFLDSFNQMPLSYLRAERRARAYAALAFARAAVATLLILLFIVGLRMGVLGVVLGSLGGAAIAAVLGAIVMARSGALRWGWDPALMRAMLRFSLPLVPAAVAGWGLNVSDRYLIAGVLGREAVGIYSAGYVVGQVISALVVTPFTLTWGATYWELWRSGRAARTFPQIFRAFTVIGAMGAVGLSTLGTDAIRLLLGTEFEAGRFVVPFSAFAYVLYGLYSIVASGLNIGAATRWVAIITGAAAATNLVLNVILLPVIGYMGAAYATLLSYAILAVAAGLVAQRYHPIEWPVLRAAASLVVGLALSGAALLGPDHLGWRLACFAAYLPMLVALGIVRPADFRRLLELRRPPQPPRADPPTTTSG